MTSPSPSPPPPSVTPDSSPGPVGWATQAVEDQGNLPPAHLGADREGRPPMRPLTEADLHSPPQRRVLLPVVLFLVTCLSTFWAGVHHWVPAVAMGGDGLEWRRAVLANWYEGLIYMAAVLAILLTHEMGHFIATIWHRIPASYPFFIPFPISPIGTMGAVIGMAGFKANRREVFDIGIAGPLAGLCVAIPILLVGVSQLNLSDPGYGAYQFDCPWLVRIIMHQLHPEFRHVNSVWVSQMNPYFMAAWVGLLVTGLNMLPVSQLDGGHVIYALFVEKAHWIARAFLFAAISYIVLAQAYMWILMLVLVTLMGADHPPTSNDRISLGWFRTALGYASLAIPLLCFPPKTLITMP